MKKLVLIIVFSIVHIFSFGQHDNNVTITNSSSAYPGIQIKGHEDANSSTNFGPNINFQSSGGTESNLLPLGAHQKVGEIVFSGYDGNLYAQVARIQVKTKTNAFSTGSYASAMHFKIGGNSNCCGLTRMTIDGETGFVGIGTESPDTELEVNGKIQCEEVQVISDVTPDYVFQKYFLGHSTLKPNYIMPTLAEVEAYIKANHHLPEVPSAQDIKEDGLQLKEMTNLLLQKIEELTLYTIEQEKRIQALEAKLNDKQ